MLNRAMNKMRETLGMNGVVKATVITTARPAYRPKPIDGRSEARSFTSILQEYDQRDRVRQSIVSDMRESIRAYN